MPAELNFDPLILRMLERELEIPDEKKFLPDEDLKVLLDCNEEDGVVRASMTGYPTRPLYKDLSKKLREWLITKKCPVEHLQKFDLLDERGYDLKRIENAWSLAMKVLRFETLFDCWSEDERHYNIREIFVLLGKRGLLDLLGMRNTVGSREAWPPSRKSLEGSFNKRCSPGSSSLLTVGARALTKHHHRDSTSSWWGACTGSEAKKNEVADKKVKEILDNAAWINIHGLPGEISTIEARQKDGYGVRWTCEDNEFRGFLEPQMAGGHESGWKH